MFFSSFLGPGMLILRYLVRTGTPAPPLIGRPLTSVLDHCQKFVLALTPSLAGGDDHTGAKGIVVKWRGDDSFVLRVLSSKNAMLLLCEMQSSRS
jgi:hypothetical protein